MKAKCRKCGDTIEVTHTREFKSCKCGAIYLDYGDGKNYYRAGGDPKDFDGEIEDAPEIHTGDITIEHFPPEQTVTTIRHGVVCDEDAALGRHHGWDKAPFKTDNFWSEMAEHFKAMAKLCEERSE